MTSSVSPVDLEYPLRQIQPDRNNLRHHRSPPSIEDPRWHIKAVGGRLHHQCLPGFICVSSLMETRMNISDEAAAFLFP